MVASAFDVSAAARGLAIQTKFSRERQGRAPFLPQRIAILAQGNGGTAYTTAKRQISSALEAATHYGYGSPIHLVARQLFPANGDGVGTIPVTVYPLAEAGGSSAHRTTLTITVNATAESRHRIRVNGDVTAPFVIPNGSTPEQVAVLVAAAINANVHLPVTAEVGAGANDHVVTVTAKWKGASGNSIEVEVIGALSGTTIAVATVNGAGDPALGTALAAFGNVWESMVLNCLGYDNTNALDALRTAGEGRWGPLVRKPFVAFTGTTEATLATLETISNARKDDRVNGYLTAPDSPELPFVVAARQLVRIASVARDNPPTNYGSEKVSGVVAGDDGSQWDYASRDRAVKAGISTTEVRDKVIYLSDIVTFYHPDGVTEPEYRHVVNIVKLQNVIHAIDAEFSRRAWDGAPFIPDDQPTNNPNARQPKAYIAAASGIVDGLASQAILADPETIKAGISVTPSQQNSSRADLLIPAILSSNTDLLGVNLLFSYYYGPPPSPAAEDSREGADPEAAEIPSEDE